MRNFMSFIRTPLLAKNYYTEEEIDRQLEESGLNGGFPCVVSLYAVDERRDYLKEFGQEELALWEYAFENIACEAAQEYGRAVFVGIDANRFALIFAGEESGEPEQLEALASAIAERVTAALYEFIHYTFSAGIGMVSETVYTANRKSMYTAESPIL